MKSLRIYIISGLAFVSLSTLFIREVGFPHKANQPTPANETHQKPPKSINPAHSLPSTDSSEWSRRLAARGNASDLKSTIEIFKESGNCLQYFVALHEIAAAQGNDHLNSVPQAATPASGRIYPNLQRASSVLAQTKTFCSGSDEESVARVYMSSLLNAALLGDADAQSCFIITGAAIPSPKVMLSGRYTQYLESRYIEHSAVFTQSALERADPYVAENAIYKYIESPSLHPSARDNLPLPNPYLTFRAARLASLRALPEQSVSLQKSLTTFEKLDLLTDDEIASADEWAQATYARDYSNAPKLDLNRFTPCHSLKETTP